MKPVNLSSLLCVLSLPNPILTHKPLNPRVLSNITNITIPSNTSATYPPSQTPTFTYSELFNLTDNFLRHHMYPLNIIESQSINSSLLSPDVLGRVDATRDYAGQELNTEYLFGLFANIALNPDAFTLLGYPINYTFTKFAVAGGNVVAFAVVVKYKLPVTGTVVPQELDFWVTFNDKGQISQYDGNFRYLQWQLTSTISTIASSLNLSSSTSLIPILQQKLATSICDTATRFCNGTNLQYENREACEQFLGVQTRFGEGWEWGMDTLSCRMIHQNMVPLRPDVHCAHIGPSGGGMCVDDRTYVGNLEEEYFVNAPFLYTEG